MAYTIVIGSEEMEKELLSLKDMTSGEQEQLSLATIIEQIKTSTEANA
ncbi:MAG: His/Gly/Thr/Pro-type tRNA ligase C-terminal domain-containing protein [Saprospiraceae bacterium]